MGISANSPMRVRLNGMVHEPAPWGILCRIHAVGEATKDETDCMACIAGIDLLEAENLSFQYGMDMAIMRHLERGK